MFHDNKYYVIEKDEYLPEEPKLHIISADQVKMVSVDKKAEIYTLNFLIYMEKCLNRNGTPHYKLRINCKYLKYFHKKYNLEIPTHIACIVKPLGSILHLVPLGYTQFYKIAI